LVLVLVPAETGSLPARKEGKKEVGEKLEPASPAPSPVITDTTGGASSFSGREG
jgi:hypothetical protein